MCIRISKNKKNNQKSKTRIQRKAKETKEEKIISSENRLKKQICGPAGEDFLDIRISGNKRFFFFFFFRPYCTASDSHISVASNLIN